VDKYRLNSLSYEVKLHRIYLGESPDEVGTVNQFNRIIREINSRMGYPRIFYDLDIFVYNMDSQALDEETRQRIGNLQDYDANTPGYQVASGLYWHKDKLQLGVFPDDWTPEYSGVLRNVSESARAKMLRVFCHELGHHIAREFGVFKDDLYINRRNTELYRENKAHFKEWT